MIGVYSTQLGNKGNRKKKQENENIKLTKDIDIMTRNYKVTSNTLAWEGCSSLAAGITVQNCFALKANRT